MPIPLSFRIEGERVALRAPRPGDATRLADVRARSWSFLERWSPTPDRSADPLEIARRQIRIERRAWRADRGYAFCAVGRDDDALVGRVNLNQIVRGVFQNAYLGYWIDASHARRGFMTEAVGLALAAAFGPLELHRVQAAIIPTNAPSLALARRVGFRLEGRAQRYLRIAGEWQDHDLFAMTAEEWRRR